jgi:hypothetical protein
LTTSANVQIEVVKTFFLFHGRPGCQIFLDSMYQNGDNETDEHKVYQIGIK